MKMIFIYLSVLLCSYGLHAQSAMDLYQAARDGDMEEVIELTTGIMRGEYNIDINEKMGPQSDSVLQSCVQKM